MSNGMKFYEPAVLIELNQFAFIFPGKLDLHPHFTVIKGVIEGILSIKYL